MADDRYQIWKTDEKHVYCHGRRIRADKESFRLLNDVFARDRQTIFSAHGPLREADAATFEIVGTYLGDHPKMFHSYAKDKSTVFFHAGMGRPRIIKGADATTFRWLGKDYGGDAERVYLAGYLVGGADPATFKYLDGEYSCDRSRCFFGTRLLRGVDSTSFAVVPYGDGDNAPEFARDAHRVFYRDLEVTGADAGTFQVKLGQPYPIGRDRNRAWTESDFAALATGRRLERVYPAVVVQGKASGATFQEDKLSGLERQIATFCALVQLRSAEKAARQKQKLTPDTVCRYVEELQTAVGKTLAIVGPDRIEITPDGLAFQKQFGGPVSIFASLLFGR